MPNSNLANTNHPAGLAPATVSRLFLQVDRSGFGSADRLTSATQFDTPYIKLARLQDARSY